MRADNAVEPTGSENITVTCRRSALSLPALSVVDEGDETGAGRANCSAQGSNGIEHLRRCPANPTPRTFRSLG
jgi:hypothetical protein